MEPSIGIRRLWSQRKAEATMYFRRLLRITTAVLVLTIALIAGVVVAQDDENHEVIEE